MSVILISNMIHVNSGVWVLIYCKPGYWSLLSWVPSVSLLCHLFANICCLCITVRSRWDHGASLASVMWLFSRHNPANTRYSSIACDAGPRFIKLKRYEILLILVTFACRLRDYKKLVDFPRMSPSLTYLTCIGMIRALWPTRWILTILICKWAINTSSYLFSLIKS